MHDSKYNKMWTYYSNNNTYAYGQISNAVDIVEILAIQFAQANGGSTSTTKVHAFHAFYYPLNITK